MVRRRLETMTLTSMADAPASNARSGAGHMPGPSADTLLARARALRPALAAGAEIGEAKGSLTDEAAAALRHDGFVGMWAPRELGGSSLRPIEAIRIIEELTYADSSVGWVLSTSALAVGGAGVFLGDEVVRDMFRPGALPFIAGQGVPNGRAIAQPGGGYRLSGNWNYGSGIKHANFVIVGAMVFDGDAPRLREGKPEARFFYLQRSDVEVADNWDVIGLRATGSVDHSVAALFVPEDYSFPALSPEPLRQSLAALGFATLAPAGHAAFALGIGRRMIDEIAGFAQTRAGRPGAIGDSESFREDYACAQAQLQAAHAFVFRSWEEAEAVFERGDRLTSREDSYLRLSMIHATNAVADICTFGYRAAGGTSLRRGVIQRLFRDIHAGAQHIICSPGALRNCGRELLAIQADA
jgi:alkylation response protein AidB-like acyl-CoA dehydrogenase